MFEGNVLADGQIPLTSTAIYTVPVSKRAIVTSFVVHNIQDTDTYDLLISMNVSGTDRQLYNFNLGPYQTVELLNDNSWCLGTGDIIKAHTTSGTLKLDYVLMGAEETL